jgi:hypothetical protein
MAGGFGSVNAFAARDAVRWSSGHGAILAGGQGR